MSKKPISAHNLLQIPQQRLGKSLSTDLLSLPQGKPEVPKQNSPLPDPFLNMKDTNTAHPSLRPILSKHKRSPSLSNLLNKVPVQEEKQSSRSLNVTKSHFFLPKIFKPVIANRKCIVKDERKEQVRPNKRCIYTPSFNINLPEYEVRKEELRLGTFKRRRAEGIKALGDRIGKEYNEVSFGEETGVAYKDHLNIKIYECDYKLDR